MAHCYGCYTDVKNFNRPYSIQQKNAEKNGQNVTISKFDQNLQQKSLNRYEY